MYDKTWEEAMQEWTNGHRAWLNGTHEDLIDHPEYREKYNYPEWAGDPPRYKNYRPEFTAEPTWFQMYETVSEGTPCTPPFATKEELRDYLVEYGEFYDQERGRGGWKPVAAQRFIHDEWQSSMMIIPGKGIIMGRDME
jgi:hypothetical protein